MLKALAIIKYTAQTIIPLTNNKAIILACATLLNKRISLVFVDENAIMSPNKIPAAKIIVTTVNRDPWKANRFVINLPKTNPIADA